LLYTLKKRWQVAGMVPTSDERQINFDRLKNIEDVRRPHEIEEHRISF